MKKEKPRDFHRITKRQNSLYTNTQKGKGKEKKRKIKEIKFMHNCPPPLKTSAGSENRKLEALHVDF